MKRGGSKMGYTAQFDLLSPCYKDGEHRASDFRIGGAKANPTKKGKATKKAETAKKTKPKQRGGSSCGASPSVSEMGIVDKPASLEPTKSELAWDNRMKGGQGNTTQAQTQNNLLSISFNKNNSLNTNNGSLNKIKTKILPDGTISGLAMKLIKISKNNNNPSNEKYSFEIIYKIDGQPDIKHLVLSDIEFKQFLDKYLSISEQVFPRPQKKAANAKAAAVGVLNAAANANAAAKAAPAPAANANAAAKAATASAPAPAPATTNLFANGGRKRKNNLK